jgi:glycosyltransferase involved in cell wall biosynthesis
MLASTSLGSQTDQKSRKLKLTLYRPHANIWFRNTVGMVLKRKPLPNKYAPFLDYLMQSGVEVSFTSLFRDSTLKGWLRWIFDGFELLLWCILHKFSRQSIRLIFTKKSLSDQDVIFFMHYGNFAFETENFAAKGMSLAQQLIDLKILKVVHLTHYAYSPLGGAKNLANLRADLLIAENNLATNSKFYNKYFGDLSSKFLCLPYTPAPRFQNLKSFDRRTNKLVVTGSITYKMKSKEFIEFFGVDELQPMRRKLYEQSNSYREQMDCLISDLDASRQKKASKTHAFFISAAQRIFAKQAQQDYYKKDIVDIYNSYTMFAVPEEICDLPAIGFVEGMACGAAYLGLSNPMYLDIGLIPGVHYIAYDGTVDDLMRKVEYYQKHSDELRRIADSGCLFVRRHLTTDQVCSALIEHLKAIANQAKSANW